MSLHFGNQGGSVGSYYPLSDEMYQTKPAGTPGWELAPVPGWGMNPERSGPPILAMNGSVLPQYTPVYDGLGDDSEEAANQGYIALAAAGGLFLGMFLAWAFWFNQGSKAKR
jgi:hypothetical protein